MIMDEIPEQINQEKCWYCTEDALYFDKIRKRGVIRILRKIRDIKPDELLEVAVCQTHYDIEVAKPI